MHFFLGTSACEKNKIKNEEITEILWKESQALGLKSTVPFPNKVGHHMVMVTNRR